jgi:hypothetical protein
MRRPLVTIGVLLAAVQLGCGRGDDVVVPSGKAEALMQSPAQSPGSRAGATPTAYWQAQKLIRTAELQLEVRDVRRATLAVDSVVRRTGALVTESKSSQRGSGRREAQLVVRVPSDSLNTTLVSLRRLGEVQDEKLTTQDVTKEYTDLETRLAVKEQSVARLRSLLDTRTAKLADVVEVERELSRAVSELEEMKGSRRYYDQQIALSTITITLMDVGGGASGGWLEPVRDALGSSLDILGRSLSSAIYLVTFLLPWAVLGLAGWWGVRRFRKRSDTK